MTVSPAQPYVGLRPYETAEADRFFGRSRETWEITSLILAGRLVVVYGPSGVGKTSLLMAGVLPSLGADVAYVLPPARPPRAHDPAATPEGHNPFVHALLSTWAPELPADALRGLTLSRFLRRIPVVRDRYDEAALPMVAVIDQFEEVFGDDPYRARDRERFLDQLTRAVADIDHLHLILSMRQDVVGELLAHESRLSGGRRRRYRVDSLERDAAIDAVTGPLRETRRHFAPGVAEALVDDLMTTTLTNEIGEQRTVVADTVAPINLQVVCSALWRGLPDDLTTITDEHLRGDGSYVETALTTFCAAALADIAAEEGLPEAVLWQWLAETFITDLGTRGTEYEGVASTGGMPNTVARAFEAHWILRSDDRSGSVWFELLHDVLIEPVRQGRHLCAQLADAGQAAPRDVHLRKAEYAHLAGMLPLAEEYACDAVSAGESDPATVAAASSLLGRLVADRARTTEGEQADELYEAAAEHHRRAAELFDAEQRPRAVGQELASLGRLAMQRGRFADAVGALQGAVDRRRSDVDIHLDLARALHLAGRPRAALGEYAVILAVAPADAVHQRAEALVGRGLLAAAYGDPDAARRDIDLAIRLAPGLAERPDVSRVHRQMSDAPDRRPQAAGDTSPANR